ncbi:MAG: NAD-dependent epimerase/dehydratase family protein [Acidobacteria bacterium]|nr:NAD-dependent epimerase/dehydratase family protein [Acidobacteriota bacterium]MYF66489.1 NAD-dependent epimerase/dehydratase family protein [Gammaproteobacteria bacterium]MYI75264.1 NAD-dependent epimerase/dehydratase family protein [Acidobacteriota bacterium]
MNVLITGGLGFIGLALTRALLAGGHRVSVLDDGSTAPGAHDQAADAARLTPGPAPPCFRGDVADPGIGTVFDAVRPEAVIHLAARASVVESLREPLACTRVNVCGTVNVLQHSLACGVRRFVFASTGGALYGESPFGPMSETAPAAPVSPYGASKAAAEAYVGAMSRSGAIRCTVLRLGNVYGPAPAAAAAPGVVAAFARAMLAGRRPVIYGDGLAERDFVHIDDVVEAHRLALGMTGDDVFNIASGRARTVREVFDAVAAAAGYEGEPEFAPPRPGELRISRLDVGWARRELGWRARVPFARGVARTVASMRAPVEVAAPGEPAGIADPGRGLHGNAP